jgi:hypothetical protein
VRRESGGAHVIARVAPEMLRCGIISPVPLIYPFNLQDPLHPSIESCSPPALHKSKMNFTTSGINGTITEWNGTKGSIQSDTASGKTKIFWFDKSNLVVPRYSAAYEPKVGDWVTSAPIADDDTRVGRVMQSIRTLLLHALRHCS